MPGRCTYTGTSIKWKLLDEDCSMKYEKAYNCLIGYMNFIDHGLVL